MFWGADALSLFDLVPITRDAVIEHLPELNFLSMPFNVSELARALRRARATRGPRAKPTLSL